MLRVVVPEGERITDFVHGSAQRWPDREAVRDATTSYTYAELSGRVAALAAGLRKFGVSSGDRVLLVLPNAVSFVVAHFAVLTARGVSVPCDVRIAPGTLAQIAASCSPRLIITDADGWERLASGAAQLGLQAAVVFGHTGRTSAVVAHSADALIEANSGAPLPSVADREDLAALMYTTGTTGEAKGVMLTHANVAAAVANICEFIGYTPADREVITLPISHSFGLGHVYCNLRSGGAVYLVPGLAKVGRVFTALREFGATGFPGTPVGYGLILDRYAELFADAGRGLRFAVINSAALPPHRADQIRRLLPQLDLLVYYGLTEASRSTFISLTREGPDYYTSVGRPLSHVDLRVETPDGARVGRREVGEVTIGGPTVSHGYWGSTTLTAHSFRQGRLHTGDLGYLDERGFLFLTGRLSDVINVGGYKVMPAEVEAVIRECSGVTDVAVLGLNAVPGIEGDVVVAAVVAPNDFDRTACDERCRARLEPFKVPSRIVTLDAVPKSETGKVLRSELAAAVRSRLQERAT